jgi:hypothetical protein
MQQIDWNKWLTLIAALALIAAIIIPYIQKKYEERKSKTSFRMYLKKYLGVLFNILTYDKIDYTLPSTDDSPVKLKLTFDDYIRTFEKDFNEHQRAGQFRVAFTIILNLQNLLFVIHRIQLSIKQIDVNKLYEQTLDYGINLTNNDLNKIYSILLIMENFNSLAFFHDRFGSLKSVKRENQKGEWIGLIVDQSLLKNQQIILDDLVFLIDNKLSIYEITSISKLLIQELKSFYGFKKLSKNRKEK